MKELLQQSQTSIQPQSMVVNRTTRLVMGAMLATLAAIFQSAGAFVGFGYAFSILATMPIILACLLGVRVGLLSYVSTILVLAIIQPTEVFIFPFTTGLLGISIGIASKYFKKWSSITLAGGLSLTIGILLLLYVIKFPVLGPSVSHSFEISMCFMILLFSLFYSFVWTGLSSKVSKILFKAVSRKLQTNPS